MTTSSEIDQRIQGSNVLARFVQTVAEHGERVALRWKDAADVWHEMTYQQLADAARAMAANLTSRGIQKGDRVVLMMSNRPEFHVCDLGVLIAGGTPISIYNSSASDQVQYLVNDAGATFAIVEDAAFLQRFAGNRDGMPTLSGLAVVDAGGDVAGADTTYAELIESDAPADLEAAAANTGLEDLVTLIYTSGTTGPSKGVMLDHANVCWTAESLYDAMGVEDVAGMRIVSYLPMAHIAERMVSYYMALLFGTEITCCPDPALFPAYAQEVRPEMMFGVPRVWEKIAAGVDSALAADPEKKKAVAEAVEAAAPIAEKMTWGTATDEEKETYAFLDAVAFSTIRELVGVDQLKIAVTGAAPLAPPVLSWFRTIGVPLSEIYGLSETSGPMTWDAYEVKSGFVGRAIPGIEVKLDEDGEVLCRGGNVFRGYLNQPELTAEVLDADGWFRSGDIGVFDDDGYLKIVDRKKELIITAGGKNLSPSNLENALKQIPLVGQAIAIGDQRPFVSALVVLDPDFAPQWAQSNGVDYSSLEELATNPEVVAEIESALPEAMVAFSNAEKVKKVRVLGEEWLPDTDLLTPTSKLKRRGIHERYRTEIEELYQ